MTRDGASVGVTIVCGMLGSGKTTLLKRLLANPGDEKIVALVNDFAAINIDAALIESVVPGGIALTNGCVCCSIKDDLAVAMVNAARMRPTPSRIVLECSGLSHPAGVLSLFEDPLIKPVVHLDAIFCIIDTEAFPTLDYALTELAVDQAALSDIVVLNKMDLAGPAGAESVMQTLLGAQPSMRFLRTSHSEIPHHILLDVVTVPRPNTARTGDRGHGTFKSAAYAWSLPVSMGKWSKVIADLPATVLRAKGLMQFESNPGQLAVFQLVGKRSTLELTSALAPSESQVVFIWREADSIEEVLASALVSCGARHVHARPRSTRERQRFPVSYHC